MLDFQIGLIPPTLDVSECAEVGLYHLKGHFQPLKFAPHAKVAFYRATLPRQVDVSQCAQVSFYKVDAAQTENLTFAENATVEVDEMSAWPKVFDASKARRLKYVDCSLDGFRGVLVGENAQALQMSSVSELPSVLNVKQTPLVLMQNFWADDVHKIQVNDDFQRDILLALNSETDLQDKILVRYPKEHIQPLPRLNFTQNTAPLHLKAVIQVKSKKGGR